MEYLLDPLKHVLINELLHRKKIYVEDIQVFCIDEVVRITMSNF